MTGSAKLRPLSTTASPYLAMLAREVDSPFTLSLVGLSYNLDLMVVHGAVPNR